MLKAAFHTKKTLLTTKLDLNLRKKLREMPHLWCWRRTDTSRTDLVKNEVLQSIKEERDVRRAAK